MSSRHPQREGGREPRRAPRWAAALLHRLAPATRRDEVLGDLEEAHLRRLTRRGRVVASLLTALEALDMATALLRERHRRRSPAGGNARPLVTGRAGSPFSLLDFKLGLRMLVRYPGLTVVAGVAMAFAVAVGSATFEFLKDTMVPTLPLPEGDRVVRLQAGDARVGGTVPATPDDMATWRRELTSVAELGAFHPLARALQVEDAAPVPVDGVAVSASAFGVARVAPLLGRPLVPGDEAPGAAPVVVLGHDLWRSLFGADPEVIGRVVRLGEVRTTVVGVMPADYAFPLPADLWVPLRIDELASRQGAGEAVPGVLGFGRLAPGATLESARAELASLEPETSAANPEAAHHVTATLDPFAYPVMTISGITTSAFWSILAFLLATLMLVVCGNVALLLFARAASREAELAVRAALGAGRGRIVAQLFVEALVLAGVSTLAGLWGAAAVLKWTMALIQAGADPFPFWIDDTLSASTVGWAAVLALFGAVVAGVIPGFQITGRGLHTSLQGSGRGAGPRMGRLWTSVVVGQVALTVLFMPVVFLMAGFYWNVRSARPGFAEDEYLIAHLEAEGDGSGFVTARQELLDRLAAEPRVRAVTLSDRIWPVWLWSRPIEVEDETAPPAREEDRRAQHLAVAPDFFEAMDAHLVAGRGFTERDAGAEAPVVVVNESFVRTVLGGRNAVGRRIRIGDTEGVGAPAGGPEPVPWTEIVGVIADLGLNPHSDLPHRGVVFHPLEAGMAGSRVLTVRVTGDPADVATRVRVLALGTDPPLRLERPEVLAHRRARPVVEYGAWLRVVVTTAAVALLLALAGIYSIMAFTVSRRTREIGVRVALGALPHEVAKAVFSRGVTHVAYGVAVGSLLFPILAWAISLVTTPAPSWPPLLQGVALLAGYMAFMMGVCLLACVVPLRRALRIEPTEALAAEG